MPLKFRPRFSSMKLEKWIDDRADKLDTLYPDQPKHLRYENWISMVGGDPDKPKVDKANLMRAFDLHSRDTIYRWLAKMKREMKQPSVQ